jgi:hypothetical protein
MTENNNPPAIQFVLPGFGAGMGMTWRLLKDRILTFTLIASIGIIFTALIIGLWVFLSKTLMTTMPMALIIIPVVGIILFMLPVALMGTAFFFALARPECSVLQAYKLALPKFFGMLCLWILMALFINGGFLLLIVPGVILTVWFYFSGFVYVREGIGCIDALVQSREYVRGHFIPVAIRLLLIIILCAIAVIPCAALVFIPVIGRILTFIGSWLIGMFFFTYGYTLYQNLLSRPDAVKTTTLSKEAKIKSLGLGLAGAAVFLIVFCYSLPKISDIKTILETSLPGRGTFKDILFSSMTGEKKESEEPTSMESAMQNIMQQAMGQMANQMQEQIQQSGQEVPEEMKEMLKAMQGAQKTPAQQQSQTAPEQQKPAPAQQQVAQNVPAPKTEEKIETTQWNQILQEIFKDNDWMVRRDGALSLGEIGGINDMHYLEKLLRDKHPEVRVAAVKATNRIRSRHTK